jgi:hypothetical protein
MKRLYWTLTLVALVGSLTVSLVRAQDATTTPSYNRLVLGPAAEAGGSIWTGSVADKFKTSQELSFEGGIMAYYATNESFAFTLGLAYDSRGVNFHNYNDATIADNLTLGYFSIQPGLKFKDFTLGLGIGLPMTITDAITANGQSLSVTPTTNQATLVEIRLGASVPIATGDGGEFRFIVDASYPFTNTFNNLNLSGGTETGTPYKSDGPTATLRAGFCYLFTLMH